MLGEANANIGDIARRIAVVAALFAAVTACDLGGYSAPDAMPSDAAVPVPDAQVPPPADRCSSPCHGSSGVDAPPSDLGGNTDTSFRGVGAHRSHLAESSWHKPFSCVDCHQVPTELGSPGHIDSDPPAELTFTLLGATTTWNGETCSNNYCHGSTLSGGSAVEPVWTVVDGSQSGCSSCHGQPPPAPHPQASDCGTCHQTMNPGQGMTIAYPELHIDGKVDVNDSLPCESCHGSIENAAPPQDLAGNTPTSAKGVGAHQAHLLPSSWHKQLECVECHTVPLGVADVGHADTPLPAELAFTQLGATTSWNGASCSASYCHGSTLSGGAVAAPNWTQVDGSQTQCDSCHGSPPPSPHPNNPDCGLCHQSMSPGNSEITYAELHINGVVELVTDAPCDSCHGSGGNAAPPSDIAGNLSPLVKGVGAHRNHLGPSDWHKEMQCTECHQVPTSVTSVGHMDTGLPAELTFGPLAGAASWNNSRCSNSYCHGSTLTGGAATQPLWTNVDGTQSECGSCHGAPPPAPHPNNPDCGLCHQSMLPGSDLVIAYPDLHIDGNVDVVGEVACDSCHGSNGSSAPPRDMAGNTATTTRGVGAHRSHLGTSDWHKEFDCAECHQVPTSVAAIGHADTPLPAELTFGPLAGTASWNGFRCSNTYCHGSNLTGGSAANPQWTLVDGSQSQCGSCHGAPPPAPHPNNSNCGLCHQSMVPGGGLAIAYPELHVNGVLDVTTDAPCDSCHGSNGISAPPSAIDGSSSTLARGVGAHRSHLGQSDWHSEVLCSDCHKEPLTVNEVGHVDTPLPAELTFGARAGNAEWNGTGCTNTYCHGSTMSGGNVAMPVWTQVDGAQTQCDSCHGAPPPAPHPQDSDCGVCHQSMTPGVGLAITYPGLHIDGNIDVRNDVACDSCHGSEGIDAPPVDLAGNTDPSLRGVGAHRSHLGQSLWHQQVQCSECHQVPTSVGAIGHADTPLPAELTFGPLAGNATWNGATCSDSYCHGSTLTGGSATAPLWTQVDGTQAQCGSCHGAPPPAPHPNNPDCGQCHDTMVQGGGLVIAEPLRHIDGNVDVTGDAACDSCHGSAGNAAPPTDVGGNTSTLARGVGAHRRHLRTSTWHKQLQCTECHNVPTATAAIGHADTPLPAELSFNGLATATSWNGLRCSNSYCHGSSLTGGSITSPVWTQVDGTQSACGSCHGTPPPAPHPNNPDCGLCHDTMTAGGGLTITDPSRHIDGNLDVTGDAPCDSCHGSGGIDAPPTDVGGNSSSTLRGVGAHRSHIESSGWHRQIDCAECHRVPSSVTAIGHADTPLPAELSFTGMATATSWNGNACSNSYCHGSTLAGGTVSNPVWTQVDGTQAQCGSCHGTPPPAPHPANGDCGLCHDTMAEGDNHTIVDPARHIDGVVDVVAEDAACDSCHGGFGNAAPPVALGGNVSTAVRGVGAHQSHLGASTWHVEIACEECHSVPTTLSSMGHVDTPPPAELAFGPLAGTADWNGITCSNSYCHGSTLTGGNATQPVWTQVDGTQSTCSSCHGAPPPAPHPQNADCGLCHDTMTQGGGLVIADPTRHINGTVDVIPGNAACDSCHGSGGNAAPPTDLAGNTATTARGVGAHRWHLGASSWHKEFFCTDCHREPTSLNDPGHVDTALPAELTFGSLSSGTNWDGISCSNAYCHGASLTGGTASNPVWTQVTGNQSQCNSCHGAPPPAPHPANSDCGMCHDTMSAGGGLAIIDPSRHIDGVVDVLPTNVACDSCHGSAGNAAPPRDLGGAVATTSTGVGAHREHLDPSSWHKQMACSDCHIVPIELNTPGHVDTAEPAELTFGALAGTASWNGDSCNNSYCHGSTLTGGTDLDPVWTQVDGTQSDCGSCHGVPPPSPHPANSDCGLCHQSMTSGAGLVITYPDLHIDGNVDVIADNAACDSCHGSGGIAAPPQDLSGNTGTGNRGVGAHRQHLQISDWHKPVDCTNCHRVPASVGSVGHVDTGAPAELTFSALGAGSTWNNTTCSNSYCHGSTLTGGNVAAPVWTTVNGSQTQCNSCHGAPPPPPHPSNGNCGTCHQTMNPGDNTTIIDPLRHIDGTVDVTNDAPCDSCHGSGGNAAPPTDVAGNSNTNLRSVGAHRSHLGTSDWHREVACSECHTVPTSTTAVGHIDSDLPAELTFAALAAGTSWNGLACSNSYCHGSTLSGGGATAPVWTSVNGSQSQCGSCHGAPPPAPHSQNTDCGLCHQTMNPGDNRTFIDPARHIDGTVDVVNDAPCDSCHGSGGVAAPPQDVAGNTLTTFRGVGAHRNHLGTSAWRKEIQCSECHSVPTSVNAVGHADTPLPAELRFGALAGSASWSGITCSNSYCHGSSLSGGTATAPTWTLVDGSQSQCGSCHGAPPPSPHPNNSDCGLCHQTMNPGDSTTIIDPARHIDGTVDVIDNAPCDSCHGSAGIAAPPTDVAGNTSTTLRSVGAHRNHLGTSDWHKEVQCTECHQVPTSVNALGHADTPLPAELTFGPLSGGAIWNGATCSDSYCHGSTLTGGSTSAPLWTQVDGSQAQCGSCHGAPPPAPHPQNADCGLCHQTMTPGGGLTITMPALHIDGNLDVLTDQACDTCHGSGGVAAPPFDTSGNTTTTNRGVGAHRSHLGGSSWHKEVECAECHSVPTSVVAVGHMDTPTPAELTFGLLAAGTTWDGITCSNSYCHGSTLSGGSITSPRWTLVNGNQSQCSSCHGFPPPAPHPQNSDCGLCHDTLQPGNSANFVAPLRHIDGNLDVSDTQACDSCHGSGGVSAPPVDVLGGSTTNLRGVGAHRSHVNPSTWHKQVECQECHKVPTGISSLGHLDSALPAELTFGPLAGSASWNGMRCSNSYCHGSTLSGGTATAPEWTLVNGSQKTCSSCHGFPPPTPHPQNSNCGLCHDTMNAGGGQTIADPIRHIDGNIDVNDTGACDGCHGSGGIAAPPQDTSGNTSTTVRGVGAHRSHLGTSSWHKEVQCSYCHRVPTGLSSLGHIDTPLPAELTFSSLASGTSWSVPRCSNSYCHGSTLTGGNATQPIWTTVNGSQSACNSCHGSPPPPPHNSSTDCGKCHLTPTQAPNLHIDGEITFDYNGHPPDPEIGPGTDHEDALCVDCHPNQQEFGNQNCLKCHDSNDP